MPSGLAIVFSDFRSIFNYVSLLLIGELQRNEIGDWMLVVESMRFRHEVHADRVYANDNVVVPFSPR
jgi:hypothetical protein